MTRYVTVEFPAPTLRGPACQACEGVGVTGERHNLAIPNSDDVVLVDVFCPACQGCGHAEHGECRDVDHPGDPNVDYAELVADARDDPEFDQEELFGLCPSCHGREFWVATGFAADGGDRVFTLRVPCGCTEARAKVIVEPAGDIRAKGADQP